MFIKVGLERLLFSSDVVAIGTFRCDVSSPLFHDSGATHDNVIVFPRRMIRIHHERGPSFVADPTTVPLYNRGQKYTRTAISLVDRADWFVLSDDILGEIADPQNARRATRAARSGHLFTSPFTICNDATYLRQRQIFEALSNREPVDVLGVEETMIDIARRVLRRDARPFGRSSTSIVASVKTTIGNDLARNHSLRDLASSNGVTPFHLCRIFKDSAGMTLTQYRHSLRMRAALPRVRKSSDLSSLATELGYASHSHFTRVFRRHFGVTPSALRA